MKAAHAADTRNGDALVPEPFLLSLGEPSYVAAERDGVVELSRR